jgi:hypothetical protein
MVDRDGLGDSVTCDVHAEEFGEFTHVFDFESLAHGALELHHPLSVVTCEWEVININPDHGEDVVLPIDIDAGFGLELSPSIGNQSIAGVL